MPRETVMACPACDEASVETSATNGRGPCASHDHQYRCGRCGHTFDEPVERENRSNGGPSIRNGLAARLERMNADDIGGGA